MPKRCDNCRHGCRIEIDEPCKIFCAMSSNLAKGKVILVADDYKCRKHEYRGDENDERR